MSADTFAGLPPEMLAKIFNPGGPVPGQQELLTHQLALAQAMGAQPTPQRFTAPGAAFSGAGSFLQKAMGAQQGEAARKGLLLLGQQRAQAQAAQNSAINDVARGQYGERAAPPQLLTPPATQGGPDGMAAPMGPRRLLTPPGAAPAAPQVPAAEGPRYGETVGVAENMRKAGLLAIQAGQTDYGKALIASSEFLAKQDADGAGKANETAKFETQLRDKLGDHPQIRAALAAKDFYGQITGAPATGNGDLSRIYGMAKLLDPGGRVTDSDAENAAKTGTLRDDLQALYNRVSSGGSLAPGVRKQMDAEAARLYRLRVDGVAPLRQSARKYATDYGLNPDRVDVDLGLDAVAKRSAAPSGEDADALAWAKARAKTHPDDPRVKKILSHLSGQ